MRHHDVEQVRPRRVEHLSDGPPQLVRVLDPLCRHAKRVGHLHKVREDILLVLAHVPLGLALAQVGVRPVCLVEAVLPLDDHAQVLVVQDEALGLEVLHGDSRQLLAVHHKRPVAVNVDHHLLRPSVPAVKGRRSAERRRQAEAHAPQSPRSHPVPGLGKLIVLCRPHLVLPDARADDRLSVCLLVQHLDRLLRHDHIVPRRVGVRVLLSHAVDLLEPLRERVLVHGARL